MAEFRFSRRTVIAAVEVMEGSIRTQAALTRYFLKWGPELAARCNDGSLADRFNHLIKFFDEQPRHRVQDGELLADTIAETAVPLLPSAEPPASWRQPTPPSPQASSFLRMLALDGFTVTDGALRRTLPADLGLPQAEDDITRLLNKHGFATPRGHLDQAHDAHGRGDWASANAQLRSFFEGLLDEIAIKLDPSASGLPTSENRRARLASIGFLIGDLNEWSNDGKNFINGLWKRLHPAGSHPGLSDQDDSTFRRHIVLLTAQLLLVRFDARSGP